MKKIKLMALALVLIAMATNANAQADITLINTATARIVINIGMFKTEDMNFGNIAANPAGGTIILDLTGTRTIGTGSVTLLPVGNNPVTAASFTAFGQANSPYFITLPALAVALTHTNGANTMTVTAFTCNVGASSSPAVDAIFSGAGFQILKVGATLNVGALQPEGLYVTSTPFKVTVNY